MEFLRKWSITAPLRALSRINPQSFPLKKVLIFFSKRPALKKCPIFPELKPCAFRSELKKMKKSTLRKIPYMSGKDLCSSNIRKFQGMVNLKKNHFISGNGKPKIVSHISGNRTFQSTKRKRFILQEMETLRELLVLSQNKSFLIFLETKNSKKSLIYLEEELSYISETLKKISNTKKKNKKNWWYFRT